MSNQNVQRIRTLKDPIVAEDHTAPLVLKVATPSVPNGQESTVGPMANPLKARTYVLVDVLPKELQDRIKTVLESLSWG